MAEFNKGINRDSVKDAVNKNITQTATGLAETTLKDINKWREVVAENPSELLPFKLPPTLQGEIDGINDAIAFTGLKIPPVDELDSLLKKKLGDLAKPTIVNLNKKLDPLDSAAIRGIKDLQQITWLG
jgi:hypothetical protein